MGPGSSEMPYGGKMELFLCSLVPESSLMAELGLPPVFRELLRVEDECKRRAGHEGI